MIPTSLKKVNVSIEILPLKNSEELIMTFVHSWHINTIVPFSNYNPVTTLNFVRFIITHEIFCGNALFAKIKIRENETNKVILEDESSVAQIQTSKYTNKKHI
jgi:hypothetical protein